MDDNNKMHTYKSFGELVSMSDYAVKCVVEKHGAMLGIQVEKSGNRTYISDKYVPTFESLKDNDSPLLPTKYAPRTLKTQAAPDDSEEVETELPFPGAIGKYVELLKVVGVVVDSVKPLVGIVSKNAESVECLALEVAKLRVTVNKTLDRLKVIDLETQTLPPL